MAAPLVVFFTNDGAICFFSTKSVVLGLRLPDGAGTMVP
jgi:hypothetical protein